MMMMMVRNVAMTAPTANPPKKLPTPLEAVTGGLDSAEVALVPIWGLATALSCCMQTLCVGLLSCGAHCLFRDTEVPFSRMTGLSWESNLAWSLVMSVLAVILPSGLE